MMAIDDREPESEVTPQSAHPRGSKLHPKVISRNTYPKSELSTPPSLPLLRGGAVGGGVMLVFSYQEIT